MALNDAQYQGVENIMLAFDRMATEPYYSVWNGKDLLFQFNEDDLEKGRQMLAENLEAWAQGGNRDILKIKFHGDKQPKYITDSTPIIGSMKIRPTPWDPITYTNERNSAMQSFGAVNTKIMEVLNGLDSRIKAIEENNDIEEEEKTIGGFNISGLDSFISGVNKLFDGPVGQHLIGKLFKNAPMSQTQPVISGIPQQPVTENEFNEALLILKEADPDLERDLIKLSMIAKNKKIVFAAIIDELRSMKI